MGLTNVARNLFTQAIIGETITPFSNANSYFGVGDSSTAFAAAQTDLQAASNKTRKAMEPTYPIRATNVITFRAVFGTADANYAWNEWAIFNASSSGSMLSRKVASLGTKDNTQSWQVDGVLTINVS